MKGGVLTEFLTDGEHYPGIMETQKDFELASEEVLVSTPATAPIETSRLWLLDFIRQISILTVLSLHLVQTRLSPLPESANSIYWLLTGGDIGVWMFFVVSGFVISDTAHKRFKSLDQIRARDFYIVRAARLIPLFLVAVILGIICTKIPELRLNPKYNDVFDYGGKNGLFWLTLFTGTFNWLRFGLDRFYGMHWDIYWSLAVEEQFYFFYPWLCKVKSYKWILLSLLVIAPLGRLVIESTNHTMFRNLSSFCALDLLSAGVLLFLVTQKHSLSLRRHPIICHSMLLLGGSALVFTMMQTRTFFFDVLGPTAIAASLFVSLLGGLNIAWIQKLPSWFVIGGKLSYGAYLLHPAILFWLVPYIFGKSFSYAFVLYAVVVLVVAHISFSLFEQQVNRLIKKSLLKKASVTN